MSVMNELHVAKKISWGSIIGGVVTVLAVSLLLSTLGTSLGFSIVDPLSDEPVNGVGTTVLVWSAISIIISLAVGAFIAGRLAAMDGLIHGFLVWATALIVAAILGSVLLGGAMKATGNALGSVASLTGNVISGAGSAVGGGVQGLANMGGQVFNNLNLDTTLQPEEMTNEVAAALRKSNIASLHPDYMKTQLEGAKTEIGEAVKAMAISPNNSDTIVQNLVDKLKKRGEALAKDVDRDSLTKALSENTSMSQEEVNQTVDNLIEAKNRTAQLVNQRLSDVEAGIEQAKQQYAELKQAAREEAAAAASAMAHAALWSFFALLIGAVVSALAGLWGVKTCNRHFHIER
ncbi:MULTISPECIES: CAP-Gly protein [unclassified Brenneria]|uniref:CAP-Gly protein n=1 Tax=unclassified Brenneria TaxID=2634434 RepID=UPI0015531DC4|nr:MULTISPECIES: CAP-Gly protein [unclassified Brenneria]MBJ7221478.1 CAP-Gly protein [Brenneria sp. L3-3C-1]MEE3642720.1 CAP-Gly protein [Brenneria sp. L3_3C_1]MEE3652645.1 CAP-Gly protein [Brenneria sp. HEZEL_4_2_4]NPD02603.1 CAP-Gly protein [Brenneria sp. hezel4-2-4]